MSLITQTQNMLKRQEENEQKEKARPTFVTPSTIQVTTTRFTTRSTTTTTRTTTTASTTSYNWFTSEPTQRPFPLQAVQSVTVQGSESQSNNIDTGLLSNINQGAGNLFGFVNQNTNSINLQ